MTAQQFALSIALVVLIALSHSMAYRDEVAAEIRYSYEHGTDKQVALRRLDALLKGE